MHTVSLQSSYAIFVWGENPMWQMSLVYLQEGLRLVVLYVSVRGKVDEVFTRQRKYPERTEIVSPQLEWFELLSR